MDFTTSTSTSTNNPFSDFVNLDFTMTDAPPITSDAATTFDNPFSPFPPFQGYNARTLAHSDTPENEETSQVKYSLCKKHKKERRRQQGRTRPRKGAPVDPSWELCEKLEAFHFEHPPKKPNKKGATVHWADEVVTDVKVVSRWQDQTEKRCPHPDHCHKPVSLQTEKSLSQPQPQPFSGNPLNPSNWGSGSHKQCNVYGIPIF